MTDDATSAFENAFNSERARIRMRGQGGVQTRSAPPRERAGDDPETLAFVYGILQADRPIDFSVMVTNPRALWYKDQCAECGHTFRVGDPVVVCPNTKCDAVYHQDPVHGLDCFSVVAELDGKCRRCGTGLVRASPPEQKSANDTHRAAFVNGLKEAFGDKEGLSTLVVGEDLEGRRCAVCGHTVRRSEVVVHCPCGNGPGGQCPAVIHLDVARRLRCWPEWQSGRGQGHCPLTGAAFRK